MSIDRLYSEFEDVANPKGLADFMIRGLESTLKRVTISTTDDPVVAALGEKMIAPTIKPVRLRIESMITLMGMLGSGTEKSELRAACSMLETGDLSLLASLAKEVKVKYKTALGL